MGNSIIETYPRGIAGFQRYVTFLDTQADIADRAGAVEIARLSGTIDYLDVSFGYTSDRTVVKGLPLGKSRRNHRFCRPIRSWQNDNLLAVAAFL